MVSILDYSKDARFNIKAVSQKTEIQAVTIRAWEGRYGLLEPQRALNGYRLYSERDIAVLNWVKKQVDAGLSISSVAADLNRAISKENWPEAVLSDKGPVPRNNGSTLDIHIQTQQLTTALVRIDERMAADIFGEILGSVTLIQLFELVLIPILVDIGLRWEHGEISVATEHFASNFILGKIQGIYRSLPLRFSGPKVIVGCGPDELHEIGSLMFAALLRDAGYRVEYLGPDIPLEDLAVYAGEENSRMVIISATIKDSALKLLSFSSQLDKLKQRPIFGFGGAAFNLYPEIITNTPGVYLGKSFTESLDKVKSLVSVHNLLR
jgi:MerR family transcriptional regulator, light-induced transcriptional regulator